MRPPQYICTPPKRAHNFSPNLTSSFVSLYVRRADDAERFDARQRQGIQRQTTSLKISDRRANLLHLFTDASGAPDFLPFSRTEGCGPRSYSTFGLNPRAPCAYNIRARRRATSLSAAFFKQAHTVCQPAVFEDTNPDETSTACSGRRRALRAASGLLVLAHPPPALSGRRPHRALLSRVLLRGRLAPDVAARAQRVASSLRARGRTSGRRRTRRG